MQPERENLSATVRAAGSTPGRAKSACTLSIPTAELNWPTSPSLPRYRSAH